ncbi:type II toxin-antitoxin system VapB family antitoxin [Cyanobium sp. Morenito 9A2]|nr:type II toxin-antitoxin system VapB family antitoxin [Cyanobium sp. Morenito 9A2]
MRTTVTLDDQLLAQANELSGIPERTQLLQQAL